MKLVSFDLIISTATYLTLFKVKCSLKIVEFLLVLESAVIELSVTLTSSYLWVLDSNASIYLAQSLRREFNLERLSEDEICSEVFLFIN